MYQALTVPSALHNHQALRPWHHEFHYHDHPQENRVTRPENGMEHMERIHPDMETKPHNYIAFANTLELQDTKAIMQGVNATCSGKANLNQNVKHRMNSV